MKQGTSELIGFLGCIIFLAGFLVAIISANGGPTWLTITAIGVLLGGFLLAMIGAWDLPGMH